MYWTKITDNGQSIKSNLVAWNRAVFPFYFILTACLFLMPLLWGLLYALSKVLGQYGIFLDIVFFYGCLLVVFPCLITPAQFICANLFALIVKPNMLFVWLTMVVPSMLIFVPVWVITGISVYSLMLFIFLVICATMGLPVVKGFLRLFKNSQLVQSYITFYAVKTLCCGQAAIIMFIVCFMLIINNVAFVLGKIELITFVAVGLILPFLINLFFFVQSHNNSPQRK